MLASFLMGIGLVFGSVAMAGPVVVVGADSPISALTQSQVRQVFNGQLRQIQGAAVKPLDLPGGDVTRNLFYRNVTGKTAEQMKSYWARMIFTGRGMPPREVSSEQEMGLLVGSDSAFVGYLEETRVPEGLKVVYRP